jgi:hypothetical protein
MLAEIAKRKREQGEIATKASSHMPLVDSKPLRKTSAVDLGIAARFTAEHASATADGVPPSISDETIERPVLQGSLVHDTKTDVTPTILESSEAAFEYTDPDIGTKTSPVPIPATALHESDDQPYAGHHFLAEETSTDIPTDPTALPFADDDDFAGVLQYPDSPQVSEQWCSN